MWHYIKIYSKLQFPPAATDTWIPALFLAVAAIILCLELPRNLMNLSQSFLMRSLQMILYGREEEEVTRCEIWKMGEIDSFNKTSLTQTTVWEEALRWCRIHLSGNPLLYGRGPGMTGCSSGVWVETTPVNEMRNCWKFTLETRRLLHTSQCKI
jgi:hypothetical protein